MGGQVARCPRSGRVSFDELGLGRPGPDRSEQLDLPDAATHGHPMASGRQLLQRRDERERPAGHGIDVGREMRHPRSPRWLRGSSQPGGARPWWSAGQCRS